MKPSLSWQPSLLGGDDAPRHSRFGPVERVWLDDRSWVDYGEGWLCGSDELFAALAASAPWTQRSRRMFDRYVQEPRLTASWTPESAASWYPPALEAVRRALSQHYGVAFDSVGFNLYRDGRDSVAWHRDRIAREIPDPVVALVSLGEPRRLLLRPRGGGRSRSFMLGRGDLFVTGGRTQREWEHTVPKVPSAGPRISVAFRHGTIGSPYQPPVAGD